MIKGCKILKIIHAVLCVIMVFGIMALGAYIGTAGLQVPEAPLGLVILTAVLGAFLIGSSILIAVKWISSFKKLYCSEER